ncbi:MAG: hypothetical protein ACKN9F_05540 [Methylomonas sp.]
MFDINKYLKLLKQHPPRLIRNKKELENTEKVVSSLLDKLQLDKIQLTIEEREYLSVLAVLIYEYEEKNQELIPDIYGLELLKVLLEEKNLQKQDLLSIFENQCTLDNIFNGKEELTPYFHKLADLFNISPALFFPK